MCLYQHLKDPTDTQGSIANTLETAELNYLLNHCFWTTVHMNSGAQIRNCWQHLWAMTRLYFCNKILNDIRLYKGSLKHRMSLRTHLFKIETIRVCRQNMVANYWFKFSKIYKRCFCSFIRAGNKRL